MSRNSHTWVWPGMKHTVSVTVNCLSLVLDVTDWMWLAWSAHKLLVRKLEWNRPLWSYGYSWEEDIKMYCNKNVWECGLHLTASGEGQMTGICEQGDEFLCSLSSWTAVSCYRNALICGVTLWVIDDWCISICRVIFVLWFILVLQPVHIAIGKGENF
jgi:hypothetical protein